MSDGEKRVLEHWRGRDRVVEGRRERGGRG